MNFSFALIARNEEKTLPRLVESLSHFQTQGGQIVVLDTGSTDNTAKVARDLGCIVYEVWDKFRITIDATLAEKINKRFIVDDEEPLVEAWQSLFDFSSARNYIAELAPTDMIATPDCDEIWTTLDIDKINTLIASGIEQFEYNFVFAHDEFGKPLVQFTHSKFYDRRKMKRVGVIHEVLQGEANRLYLDESIAKLEHYQNVETNRTGYLKGLAYDCYMNPDNDRNSHYLAREMLYCDRPKSAIKEFERHISMNKRHTEASQSMIFIGESYLTLEKPEEAFWWFIRAFDKEPLRREPFMKLAEHYRRKGSPHHVIAYCNAVLDIPQSNFYSNRSPYYTYLPHELLYWAYRQVGNKEKSKEHFDKAFAYQPTNPKYLKERVFYYDDYPLISFVIPTRGDRPEGMKKCNESIDKLTYPNKEVIIVEDKERTCPEKTREGVRAAKWEWIVFASDDMEFTPESIMNAYNYCLANNAKFTAFNTGEISQDEGNICEHFMIHKSIIPNGDEIFDCEFNHVGVDNLLWAQMKKIWQAFRCEDAVINHYHRSKWYPMDDTYNLAWKNESVKKDRELLAKKLHELSR